MHRNQWQVIRDMLTILLVFFLAFVGRVEAFRYVEVGDPAPTLHVEDLNGVEVKPSFAGKLTVLLFFRPGQSFSSQALREVGEIAREFQGKGVEILAVTAPVEDIAALRASVKNLGFSLPFFIDTRQRTSEAYGVIVHPSTGIIGKDGALAFYQPSRNSNYKEIIGGKLKVLLGLISETEYEARLTQLGETITGNGHRAQHHYRAGLAFFQDGKTDDAARELAQAIALSPTFQDAHLQLGYVLLETGDARTALKEFEDVKKQSPMSPAASIGIGIAYLRLGEENKGLKLLEDAVAINPNPVRGYVELGKVYEKQGNLTKALYYYKRAIQKLQQGRK